MLYLEFKFSHIPGAGKRDKLGINGYTLLYIKWITNKDLLYSTGDYIRYLVITHKGKKSGKEYIYKIK